MQSIEIEAKTTKEAITLACEQLSATPEQLNIEIIEQGPGMIASLFSSKKAKIRATRISAPLSGTNADAVVHVQTVLDKIVNQIQAEATASMEYRNDEILFTIKGDGSGIFIGKHGQTLEAIQYLLNKIRLSRFRDLPHILVDCESYRVRHFDSMVDLANRTDTWMLIKGADIFIARTINSANHLAFLHGLFDDNNCFTREKKWYHHIWKNDVFLEGINRQNFRYLCTHFMTHPVWGSPQLQR
jgi:spoIIIJ-associated protein